MKQSCEITLTCNLDGKVFECKCNIVINKVDERVACISWEVYSLSSNQRIAGVSRNYFHGKADVTNDEIFPLAFDHIIKYRIGREKIFSNLKVVKTGKWVIDMNKELLMYIAYKTAETYPKRKSSNFQYGRAKVFLAMVITLTLIELALIVNSLFFQIKIEFTFGLYMVCLFSPLLIYFVIGLIFKKSVLARSIKLYKDTNFAEYGQGIGLLYMLINMFVIVLLCVQMSRYQT